MRREGKTIFRFLKTIGFLMFLGLSVLMPMTPYAQALEKEVGFRYTIIKGDTLSQIAFTHGVNVNTIMLANNLESTIIYPAQTLVIPKAKPEKNTTLQNKISQDELLLLARAIHAEARGESFEGQVAVGAVIVNRLKSPLFPDSIQEIIMQRNGETYQFSPVSDGSINLPPNETAVAAARQALDGLDPTGGALFFYNPHLATDQWIKTLPVMTTIGQHAFANRI